MRFYQVDLLDFYHGTLSARRIRVLLKHLPHDAALVRALNDGRPGWSPTDHLLADLWALLLRVNSDPKKKPKDHPVRAAMEEKGRFAAKLARLTELKSEYDERKRKRSNMLRKAV